MSTPSNLRGGEPNSDAPTPSVGATPQAPSPFHSPVKRQHSAINATGSSSESPSPLAMQIQSGAPPAFLMQPNDLLQTMQVVDAVASSKGTSGREGREKELRATLPAPECTPSSGAFRWTRDRFGGPTVKLSSSVEGGVIYWRFTWLRPNYTSGGCKIQGNTSMPTSSNFRVMPHKFGFVEKPSKYDPNMNSEFSMRRKTPECELELNYPGIYKLKTWATNASGKRISPLREEVFEIVKQRSGDRQSAAAALGIA